MYPIICGAPFPSVTPQSYSGKYSVAMEAPVVTLFTVWERRQVLLEHKDNLPSVLPSEVVFHPTPTAGRPGKTRERKLT